MYYRSTATSKILSEGSVRILNDVFGADTVASMVTDGLLVGIENPSVIDCICSGNMASAITRYREIHECSLADAKKAVYAMRGDVSRVRSIYKKKQKKAEAATEDPKDKTSNELAENETVYTPEQIEYVKDEMSKQLDIPKHQLFSTDEVEVEEVAK